MEWIILAWITMGIGILGVGVGRRLPSLRGASLAVGLALTGALGLWLLAWRQPPQEVALRLERPFSVFQTAWVFRLTTPVWGQGLGVLLAGFLVAWMGVAHPGQGRGWPRALALGMVVVATGAALTADLFTLLMAWAALDAMFLAFLLIRRGQAVADRAVMAGLVNGAALLSLWAAAWQIWRSGDSLFWSRMAGIAPLPFLVLAALIRLDIYPFHVGRPPELADEVNRVALLYILPTAVGLMLWGHLAPLIRGWPGMPWVAAALGLTALLGGLWAWAEPDPRAGLVEAAWGSAAWWALAGLAHPDVAPLAAILWPVGFALIFAGRPFDRTSLWGVPALAAILTIAGLPMMPGMRIAAAPFQAWPFWAWPLLTLPSALLLGALCRDWLRAAEEPLPSERIWRAAYGLALALGMFGLITLGGLFGAWQDVPVVFRLPLLASLGLGIIGLWQADKMHAAARGWARVRPFLSLEWMYEGLTRLISHPARALQQGLEFLSHPAVMWLWALVIAGILFLFWQETSH
ncbi:hypothetical protein [Thermoflexus sp.]|uniref:hypothetical protein n=1 Tax=Thermoflexus sp. TaxID=1969742 RepID=UPI001772D545|nr:hypothetical protein [Thermoflexus sp.]